MRLHRRLAWALDEGVCRPGAEARKRTGPLSVEQVVKGPDHPWALAFLPHRQGMLVTERPGNLQVLTDEQDGALLKVGLE
jgi:glucose/arabinose dehydrogenase